jgi:hypothetical protein
MMSDDPLSELAAQVRRAQELHTPVSAALAPGEDALTRLKALMARGRDLAPASAAGSGSPLPAALAALLTQGRAPWPAVEIAPLDAKRHPLDALAALLASERARLGGRVEPLSRRGVASDTSARHASAKPGALVSQDAGALAVADELLDALAQAPLDGAVRAAVAGALARAIARPERDAEALRAILRMVVLNRAS